MRQGETFFRSCLERVDDEGFVQPCGLPDWTRADVVAHMARNADALMNLLAWARTGDEKPMYPSAAAARGWHRGERAAVAGGASYGRDRRVQPAGRCRRDPAG